MAPTFIGPLHITGVLVSGSRNAMDMTARFPVTRTGSMAWARTAGCCFSMPSIFGDARPVEIKIEQTDVHPVTGKG